MKEVTMTRKTRCRTIALALGGIAGLYAAWMQWRKRRARRASPLRDDVAARAPVALITGASSGIGEVYARRLAREGFDLILVARRADRLAALADELAQRYGVAAEPLRADLADAGDLARVEARIAELPALLLLVNNAGFGAPGAFAERAIEVQDAMIRVHVLASVRLARAALPSMLAAGRGAIVNVSSVAAFYPISGNATYCATKTYLNTFAETLHGELVGTGVRVQALCPGFTRTEFMAAADMDADSLPNFVWLSSESVVDRSLRDLDDDRVISVPGLGYRALVWFSRLLPRRLLYILGRIAGRWRLHSASPPAFDGFRKRAYTSAADFVADLRFMREHRAEVREAMRRLSPALRERLMLAVTHVNECRYCAHFHARRALQDGLSEDEVAQLLDGVVDACPPDEVVAVLYAQHWAESAGQPDPAARHKLLETYGEARARSIETILHVIKMGNYAGNTLDYFLYRAAKLFGRKAEE